MEEEVYNAAVNGDITIFSNKNREQLLKKTYQNNNIIHVASQHQQIDFIKTTLNSFPSTPTCVSLICDQNCHGNTPLHIVAEVGDDAITERLYEFISTQCGDADGSDQVFPWRMMNLDGNTPAHVALLYGNVSVAMYLVEKDGSLARVTNHSKETLLHLAIQYHLFVTCWADMDGTTPLHQTTALEPAYCIGVIKAMLASCPEAAKVHDKKSGHTVLHLLTVVSQQALWFDSLMRRKLTKEEHEAAKKGNVALLNEKLDSLGMNFLVSQTPTGGNILHILMQYQYSKRLTGEGEEFFVRAIQKLPSLIRQQDREGNTPVHVIAANQTCNSFRSLEILFNYFKKVSEEAGDDAKCSIHSLPWRLKNGKGDTPLHVAIRARTYETAIMLLKLDDGLTGYVNNHNQTPLHLLCSYSGWDTFGTVDRIISSLIHGNAELPYMQDEDGLTPLLTAVRERSTYMIQTLSVQFPDCIEITDLKGRTLWHLFVSQRLERNVLSADDFHLMRETCNFLINQDDGYLIIRLMASKDNDGNTPLHLAIANRHFGFAQFFLDNWKNSRRTREKHEEILSVENKEGVSSYNLIGSADHLPREFEKSLFMKGNLLFGHRSSYGVPTTKIEAYANTIGVIAALLATITFTAAFTVPGGLDSDNGTPLLLRKAAFQVFMVADVVAMCSSMMVLFCLLWIMTTGDKEDSILLLDVSVFLLQTSFHATIVTFMTGLYVTTISIVPPIAIATCVTCTLLIVLMHKRLVMLTVVPFFGILIVFGRLLGHISSMRTLFKTDRVLI